MPVQHSWKQLLEQLVHSDTRALVLLEEGLAHSAGPWLKPVRNEGGNIVVTEIPALHQAHEYHPQVEDLVTSILGAGALDDYPPPTTPETHP